MIRLLIAAVLLSVLSAASLAQETTKAINGGVLNGKAKSIPKPEYPEDLRASGIQGVVRVEVIVDEGGTVISAEPVTEAKPRSTEAETAFQLLFPYARSAALEARFSPTFLKGSPVRVRGVLVYNFLKEDSVKSAGPVPGGGVLNGKAIALPKPAYPAGARAVRASGTVAVQVLLDEEGRVISAVAVSGHPLLRAASVEAARSAVFSPTTLAGMPVKVSGVLVYNFIPPETKGEHLNN
ncbi:MAG: energy transducer TonB [Pyrinomonadaceae bacterium]